MEPVRTCVGCRSCDEKSKLIRLTGSAGRIVIDVRQSAPGRGAYLHPDRRCWEYAVRRGMLTRALRLDSVDRRRLLDELEAAVTPPGSA